MINAVLADLIQLVKPGVTGTQLDATARELFVGRGIEPAADHVRDAKDRPFPATICVGCNDRVANALPTGDALEPGDLITIDVCGGIGGVFVDAAAAVGVGRPDRLVEASRSVTDAGLAVLRVGVSSNVVEAAMRAEAERLGVELLDGPWGHGLGSVPHCEPYLVWGRPIEIPDNTLISVEPIVTAGGSGWVEDRDGWTVRTEDGSRACYTEATVVVTGDSARVVAGRVGPGDLAAYC